MMTKSTPHSTEEARSLDLVDVLEEMGVEIKRANGSEITGRCPVHHKYKGRESTRYSWSINSESGLWHCWTCGARGNLGHLVSEMSADPGMLWHIQRHLIVNGLSRIGSDYVAQRDPLVSWTDYAKFAPLPPQMLELREISEIEARRFGIRWDTENKSVIIPIVSPVGELLGWQSKKSGWFRNYPEGVRKGSTLFGIERAIETTALLVESPLDVVRFHSVVPSGISALASFGASVSKEQISLLCDRFDKVIIAMDNDETGKLSAQNLSRSMPSMRQGVFYWVYESGEYKDIGEMTDDQIRNGILNITSIPPRF
jgi:DNA primase